MAIRRTVCFLAVTFLALMVTRGIGQKNDNKDEDKAYEFGFTIDGQQHRHEKKDVNGIIQGEFGFITADGIYHTTVYATDENGNFKILSMRNVRISAPLDGSPLPAGAKIENPNGPVSQPSTTLAPAPTQQPTKYPRAPFAFTTQSTIKPACAGCGYVTTQKPVPGQKLDFQTPSFQNRGSSDEVPANVPGSPPGVGVEQTSLNQGSDYPGPNQGQTNYATNQYGGGQQINPSQGGFVSNYPTQGQTNYPPNQNVGLAQTNPEQGGPLANYPPEGGSNYPRNQNEGGQQLNPSQGGSLTNYPPQGETNYAETPQNQGQLSPNPNPNQVDYQGQSGQPNYPSNEAVQDKQNQVEQLSNNINYPSQDQYQQQRLGDNQGPLSQVSVSNGAIHVPGNPDIPIQDKYPGMVDGLPNGVSVNDVTDILYKFNYTVGFHGQYETGFKNGAKIGGYFVNGRDGISRIVTYVADENGFRPKVKFVKLDLASDDVPKEGTEKTFGLKSFEFVWYPVK